jgi:hypothetical protein
MSTTLDRELEQLGNALAEARQEVTDGRLVDLTGFAEQLRGVCGRIEAADADEGRRHIDTLLTLRDELTHLAEAIQAILSEMAGSAPAGAAALPAPGP